MVVTHDKEALSAKENKVSKVQSSRFYVAITSCSSYVNTKRDEGHSGDNMGQSFSFKILSVTCTMLPSTNLLDTRN